MGRQGDTLVFPDGSVVEVAGSPGDPRSDPLVMRFTVPPGGMPTAPHVHPYAREVYRVESGELEVTVGGERRTLGAGASAEVPPGTAHAFRNASSGTVVFRNLHAPGLRFEEYFRAVHRLASQGKLSGGADPRSVLYASALMQEYADAIRPAGAVPQAAVRVLSLLARLFRTLPDAPRGSSL